MKKTFSKFLATAAAVSMLASVSAVVNADEAILFETTACEHGIVITGVSNADDLYQIGTLEIPAEIDGKAVVGIADYAFADVVNVATICIPETVTVEHTGNVAFITNSSIVDYVAANLPEEATKADLVAYIAEKLEYNGKTTDFTEEELAEVEAKINAKAELAGVTLSEDMTVNEAAEAMIAMLQNKEAMALTDATTDKLTIWETTITYNCTTVITESDNLAEYLAAKEALGLSTYTIPAGDANMDGIINVRDAAAIAAALANGTVDEIPGNGDFNGDNVVNVRDAAAIAAALANSTI